MLYILYFIDDYIPHIKVVRTRNHCLLLEGLIKLLDKK